MTLHGLPDGWTPVEALVLMKCLDEDGRSSWVYRTTAPPNRQELLGALVGHIDLLRKELPVGWDDEEVGGRPSALSAVVPSQGALVPCRP